MSNENINEARKPIDPSLRRAMELDKLLQGAFPSGNRRDVLKDLAGEIRKAKADRQERLGVNKNDPLIYQAEKVRNNKRNSDDVVNLARKISSLKEYYKEVIISQLNETHRS